MMASSKWEMGIILVTQMGVGILGNSFLLCLYNFTLLTGRKVRPTDLILNQLVLANSLVLFSRGIPHTMATFGSRNFLNDAGCKLLFYFQRVSRGICLSMTSLLSGFQAVRLCPHFSRWLELRMRSSMCIAFCCFFCWILNLLINLSIPFYITGPTHIENLSVRINYGYCFTLNPNRNIRFVYPSIFFTTDFICLSLMVWASGSTVVFLLKHKQRVQHIHSSSRSSRACAEARATSTVLILASCFCSLYSLSALVTFRMSLFAIPGQWLVDLSVFLSLFFPTVSPFVLIFRDTRVTRNIFASSSRQGKHFLLIWL
ncbi:vomeronasal type-1 receptor 1-like [Odocoileus virginianus]|uniref:Vomeronasal type-1 receptor n=1 Tax=Odocoileus virginianus TaxID=9874 RepID=A0ABM4GWY4_ODOVR